MKKYTHRRGMAIITALGVCFILLGLGTVLMINSYAHMTLSMGYFYDIESLNIAESGVYYAIHELGKYAKMCDLPSSANYSDILDRGNFVTYAYNTNIGQSSAVTVTDAFGVHRLIPPYSILIVSRGSVRGGGRIYNKIVEAIIHYQFLSQTVYSDGPIFINASNPTGTPIGNPLTLTLNANPDRFPSNIHCNYTGGNAYVCSSSNSTLKLNGGLIASSGIVGNSSVLSDIQAGNGISSDNVPTKSCVKLTYDILEDKAKTSGDWLPIDQNIPSIPFTNVTFEGKIKNDGGILKAYIYVDPPGPLPGFYMWYNLASFLPDGMEWDSDTASLIVTKKTYYHWNKDLEINPDPNDTIINIMVKDDNVSGLFVDGNIMANNVIIKASSFSLVNTDKSINLNNCNFNVYAPVNTHSVSLYAGNISIVTRADPFPGGNIFKGVLYTTKGEIKLINQCTDPGSNKITIEGVIVNTYPNTTGAKGINVINNGLNGCNVIFKYNPYVTDAIFDYDSGPVYLQPVYWRIE